MNAPLRAGTPLRVATPLAGGRTAIREWLAFDGALKASLIEAPQERWPGLIAEAVRRTGNDLAAAAGQAFDEGRIAEDGLRRVAGCSSAPGRSPAPGCSPVGAAAGGARKLPDPGEKPWCRHAARNVRWR